MNILAIESSCDETGAAVVRDGRYILSDIVASQVETHALYGGVVPEIASRAHTEAISNITRAALEKANLTLNDIDAIAVTNKPGLIGALLVGLSFAKTLAYSIDKPIIPVHHLKGHIAANYLCFNGDSSPLLEPPFSALVVSGGHTSLINIESYTEYRTVGATQDDACGECFDKVARILSLPYPGGAKMDALAKIGNKDAFLFPNAAVKDRAYDFSFSGLKTNAINTLNTAKMKGEEINTEDFCASFTKAVVTSLVQRVQRLLCDKELFKSNKFVLAGGVAANSHLRTELEELCARYSVEFYCPKISLCGDNASMIGAQGYYEYCANYENQTHFQKELLSLNAYATKRIDG